MPTLREWRVGDIETRPSNFHTGLAVGTRYPRNSTSELQREAVVQDTRCNMFYLAVFRQKKFPKPLCPPQVHYRTVPSASVLHLEGHNFTIGFLSLVQVNLA